MTDLRAAAESYLNRHNCMDGPYAAKACKVCRAYLAEHPADGETPVDAEWLTSVGFKADDFRVLNLYPFGPLGWSLSWVDPAWNDYWCGEVVVNHSRWPHPIKTRSDVRRLCSALGIALTEASPSEPEVT